MEMYQDNRRDAGDGPARTSQKQQKQQQQQQQQQQQGGMYGTGGVAKTTIGAPKLISTKLNEIKAEGEIPTVFLAKLMKSGFNTKEYLMSTLEHVSEKNIRIFRKSLEDSKKVAARNLQKSIYTNYKEFIVIGKEIMRLEKEARMVQQMMEKMEALGVGVYGGGEGEEGEELSESEKQAAKVLRRKTVRMVGQGQEEMVEKGGKKNGGTESSVVPNTAGGTGGGAERCTVVCGNAQTGRVCEPGTGGGQVYAAE